MTKQYTAPYINFQGRAREAMELYHQILGGQLSLFAFDASGKMKKAERVGSDRLRLGSRPTGFGSSAPTGTLPTRPRLATPSRSPSLDRTKVALTRAFEALADGGSIGMPLTEAPWGTAGWVTDRFGIAWNVDITK